MPINSYVTNEQLLEIEPFDEFSSPGTIFRSDHFSIAPFNGVDLSQESSIEMVEDFAASVSINEFQPNAAGVDPDPMTVELRGTAGASFSGFLISLENDMNSTFTSNIGTADRVAAVSGTFDANGLLVVTVPDIENPSHTYILTDATATVTAGTDLDTDDDGVLDAATIGLLGNVLDAVGVMDVARDADFTYADDFGGVTLTNSGDPELVFRDGLSGIWYIADDLLADTTVEDENGNDIAVGDFSTSPLGTTFGAVNPVALQDVITFDSTTPSIDSFVAQNDDFATVLAASVANGLLAVFDDTTVGDVGAQTINVNNLVVRAGVDFDASFTLGTATRVALQGATNADVNGTAGADTILGSSGNNTINGGVGADVLYGRAGDDMIAGGADNDVMIGGTGADSFIFSDGSGSDVIRDFEDGSDILDYSFHSAVSGFDDLIVIQTSQGVRVTVDGTTDSVLLKGEVLADITAADFAFAPLVMADPDLDALIA